MSTAGITGLIASRTENRDRKQDQKQGPKTGPKTRTENTDQKHGPKTGTILKFSMVTVNDCVHHYSYSRTHAMEVNLARSRCNEKYAASVPVHDYSCTPVVETMRSHNRKILEFRTDTVLYGTYHSTVRLTPVIRPYDRCHYHAPGHTMGACQAYYGGKGHTMGVKGIL